MKEISIDEAIRLSNTPPWFFWRAADVRLSLSEVKMAKEYRKNHPYTAFRFVPQR